MKKKGKKGNLLMELVKRDLVYLILMAMCLGATLFIFWEANEFETSCNDHYQLQLEKCGCIPTIWDGDFNPVIVDGFEPFYNTS